MLFDNFKEHNIREVVWYDTDEEGNILESVSKNKALNFEKGNIIQLQEEFILMNCGFFKEYKGKKKYGSIILPKGFSMRIESILGWNNKRVTFNPLLRYNKKIDTDLKCKKFWANFEPLHGMKFAVFLDNNTFMRKRKIDTLLSF